MTARKASRTRSSSLVIVGAGPAGIGLALALRRRAPENAVEIHDAGPQPGAGTRETPRIGESLPPGASMLLETLGIDAHRLLAPHLAFAGVSSLWGSPNAGHQDFWTAGGGPGHHLDRALFDRQLRSLAEEAGIPIHAGHRLVAVHGRPATAEIRAEDSDPLVLEFAATNGSAGKRHRVACDFAVDASGIRAALARRLGVARNVLDRLVAISSVVACRSDDWRQNQTRGLLMAVEYGWWYAAPMPGGRWHVTLVSDRRAVREHGLGRADRRARALATSEWLFDQLPSRLREAVCTAAPDLRTATSAILSRVAGANWLALGDAAASYDPLTSAGISKALEQADQAADALAQWWRSGRGAPLGRYEDAVFAAFNRYAAIRRAFYSQARARFPDAPFWRRRLGEIV